MPARRDNPKRKKQRQLVLFLFEQEPNAMRFDREVVRPHDWIKATGGPTFIGRAFERGVTFEVVAVLFKPERGNGPGRTWLDCYRLESMPRPSGKRLWIRSGRYVLYVSGKPYRSKHTPGVLWRPFKVRKVLREQ